MSITIYPKRKGKQGQRDMANFVKQAGAMTEGFVIGYEKGYADAKEGKPSILAKAKRRVINNSKET